MIQIFRSKTADEELADELRAAVCYYNRAVDKCCSAGLNPSIWSIYSSGKKDEYIGRQHLKVDYIERVERSVV